MYILKLWTAHVRTTPDAPCSSFARLTIMANFADWGLCVKYVMRKGSKLRSAVNDLQRYKTVANRAPKNRPATLIAPRKRGAWGLCSVFLGWCSTEVGETPEQNGNHHRLYVSHSTKCSFFGNIHGSYVFNDSESGCLLSLGGCSGLPDC